jgi:SAM-dependent methyltransferase
MDLWSLLCGRALWRAAEKIERRSHVWFNRPVRIGGTWRTAGLIEVNERIVEGPFVHARVKGRRVLDVGSGESLLALELACLGHEVTALDVRGYPLSHPNITSVRGDIRHPPLPAGEFDTVIALSTLEHVGLGFYGESEDRDGDRRAVAEIHRLTAPDGRFLLTVPFGRALTMPGHRVYDRARVEWLVDRWRIEEFLCFRRASATSWIPAAVDDAEQADSSARAEAVGLLSLRPSPVVTPSRRLRDGEAGGGAVIPGT